MIVIAALTCCLALSLMLVPLTGRPSRQVNSVLLLPPESDRPTGPAGRHPRSDLVVVRTSLQTCEARVERQPHRLPTVAIVGASYTAGIGPDNPQQSWAVMLARLMHWNAVVYGVPGAGYANDGMSGRGPVAHMLNDIHLRGLSPDLVIIQAARDDSGVRPSREQQVVRADIDLVRDQAPRARIALVTSFAGPQWNPPPNVYAINHAIVAGATAADPGVIVMNPLAGRWQFPRDEGVDSLHPDAAGEVWIARRVLSVLRENGVAPVTATTAQAAPMICDVAVGVGEPTMIAT